MPSPDLSASAPASAALTPAARTPAVWLLSTDIMTQLGGGFRQQRWCEYVLARGEPVRLFQVSGAFRVHWVDVHSVDELRAHRQAWIAAAPPRAGVRDSRGARIGRLIKHSFMVDLLYPSIYRLVAIMRAMLADAPPRVALLCSSPPFSMGLAGRIMKALHGDRIVMALDMRDLWSLHTAFPGPKFQKRLVERWVIGGADVFTTVAPALASRFRKVFGREPEVVYNVATQARPVTIDPATFSWARLDPRLNATSVKIIYTGSIPAGFYDVDGFLAAIEDAAQQFGSDRLQFVFVGAGGEVAARMHGRSIPENMIVFIPQMSHAEVAEVQQAADALLFMGYQAEDNQGQVSIKIFEYFRRERPILPVHIRARSDVDGLLRLYCGNGLEIVSHQAVVQTLVQIANGDLSRLPRASQADVHDNELLSEYTRTVDAIMKKL